MTRKQLFLITVITVLVLMLASCGGGAAGSSSGSPAAQPTLEPAVAAGDPTAGETLFVQSCSACHGPDGKGMPSLGKDLTTSTFITGTNDPELLVFVKTGRPTSDPANTTGIDMPPKGGNPALSDEQLMDIIAYIRTLQP